MHVSPGLSTHFSYPIIRHYDSGKGDICVLIYRHDYIYHIRERRGTSRQTLDVRKMVTRSSEAWERYVGWQNPRDFAELCGKQQPLRECIEEYVKHLDEMFGAGTTENAPDNLVDLLMEELAEGMRSNPSSGPGSLLRCNRCSHQWRQRGDSPPERCPGCNSPYWDRKRVRV